MNIGDVVEIDLRSSHGGDKSYAYVLGRMAYHENVVLVGTEEALGMPVHKDHCKVLTSGWDDYAKPLRARYQARFPEAGLL